MGRESAHWFSITGLDVHNGVISSSQTAPDRAFKTAEEAGWGNQGQGSPGLQGGWMGSPFLHISGPPISNLHPDWSPLSGSLKSQHWATEVGYTGGPCHQRNTLAPLCTPGQEERPAGLVSWEKQQPTGSAPPSLSIYLPWHFQFAVRTVRQIGSVAQWSGPCPWRGVCSFPCYLWLAG